MNNPQSTGAIASPIDERDWTLAAAGAATIYPESCFIDQTFMNVSMQSHIGCCVGCSGEEAVRKIVYVKTGVQHDLSFRFVYALAKALEGTKQKNADGTISDYSMYPRTADANDGTYPSLVAKILRKYGVPLAEFCPNEVELEADDFCYGRKIENIPAAAFADAATRKAGADFTVPVTEEGIKQAITYAQKNNGAVMILRKVGDTYWKDANGNSTYDKTRILPIRVPKVITSGHEEFLYGYDTEAGSNRIRIYWLNHWSKEWADNGRAWEYLDEWMHLIGELRVVVAEVPAVDSFKYNFTKQLKKGAKGADVVALQHALKLEGCFDYPTFTGTFGDVTFAAVVKFQEKYKADILTPNKLTKGTGIVGPSTLKKLNALYNA